MAQKKDAEAQTQAMTLEDAVAQVQEMLAQARQEADRIVEEARQASGSKTMSAERKKQIEEDRARGEELVEIKLFKDTGKYKDDVFVGCNGETIAIKRGERVMIKRKFAEILDNSEHQDYETAQLIERKSGEWKKAQDNL